MYEELLRHIPLIRIIARQMSIHFTSCLDLDDMVNAGFIGLIDAAKKFNQSRGIKFTTYAEFRIRGAILDELRSYDWAPRLMRRKRNLLLNVRTSLEQDLERPAKEEEIAKFLNLKLEKLQELMNQANEISFISLEEFLEVKDNDLTLWKIITNSKGENFLNDIYMKEVGQILAKAINELSANEKLVISLYYYNELSMKKVGEIIGLSQGRIAQIHAVAILKLRQGLKKRLGEDG